MTFHTSEETLFVNDIPHNECLESYREDIVEFLNKYYQYDQEIEEYGDPIASDTHKYVIRVVLEDECGDDDYRTVLNIEIDLPNNEAAQELADIVDGNIVSGMTGKKFRITYRNEIYITAESEEEAKTIFENMDSEDTYRQSRFVEMVSLEPQDD